MKNRAGGFALIAALITVALVALLKVMGGANGKSADQQVISTGNRAVASLIPSCPEAADSCRDGKWADLTAFALRKAGLQPGACMVCKEADGWRNATLHTESLEYDFRQNIATGMVEQVHTPASGGEAGEAPGGIKLSVPAPAAPGGE